MSPERVAVFVSTNGACRPDGDLCFDGAQLQRRIHAQILANG